MARKGLNIYKRKDGRWEARYIKSRNTQGKPRYGYLYATSYHKVRNNLQKVIQALNATDNEKVPATNYKFMGFSAIWLENSSTSLKESTYIRYRTLLNCYLMPSFQQLEISEITSERVCTFCKELEKHGKKDGTGLSPKTISDILSVLRRILHYAQDQNISIDVTAFNIRVKQTPKVMGILSLSEQTTLQEYLVNQLDSLNLGILICLWEASNAAEETQVEGYTGHLYEFYTLPESEWESGPITWQQAERRCEWKGGHLAVIESSTENFLLYSAMKAKGYENAYFGFSDESPEGNWKWVDGTSTAYTNWHSGEPNNQDGIEHYAMFYEKFQDGTWNDADGIIDAGCAYICEWDDPTDKISQGDSFTDQQLRIIAKDLGVPDDLNVEIKQYPKTYWKAAGLWDIYVEVLLDGKVIASGSFDVETGEMGRNIYIYSPI